MNNFWVYLTFHALSISFKNIFLWRKINYNFLQSACKRCRIHLDSYPQALEHVVFQHDVLNRLYQNKITELKGKGLRLVPMKNLNGGQDKTAENDVDQEEIDDVEECKCFLLL